jgi:hypothetical protein
LTAFITLIAVTSASNRSCAPSVHASIASHKSFLSESRTKQKGEALFRFP